MIRTNNGKEDEQLTKGQKSAIKNRDDDLIKSWTNRESAISKLRLMKATEASEALELTRVLAELVRNRIAFMNEMPKIDEIAKHCNDVMVIKNKVHKALADFYATFQT